MKAFTIGKRLHVAYLDVYHLRMFHGEELDRAHWPRLDELSGSPLSLVHNIRLMPDVFLPGVDLVVSEAVRTGFDGVLHMAFVEVHFKKLFDFPVSEPGDFSFDSDPTYISALGAIDEEEASLQGVTKVELLLTKLEDEPALHKTVGKHYEMVVARVDDIAGNYKDVRPITVKIPTSPTGWSPSQVMLSSTLLRDYPVVWSRFYIFSEDVFSRISPYIDPRYFEVVELDVQ